MNNFLFGDKKSDKLNSNINLRAINQQAKQWEHPIYGMFFMNEELKKVSGNMLKTPKKAREVYAISIVAMAMQHNYNYDWWISTLETEDSDGLIMTFSEVKSGQLKGLIRKIQVVEHRDIKVEIYETIFKKINTTAYDPDTILVCLVLTPGIYNLIELSEKLKTVRSTFEHIFLVFSGIGIIDPNIPSESLKHTYSLTQVLPEFSGASFDYRTLLEDFDEKFKIGREARLIEGGKIIYLTRNKNIQPEKV